MSGAPATNVVIVGSAHTCLTRMSRAPEGFEQRVGSVRSQAGTTVPLLLYPVRRGSTISSACGVEVSEPKSDIAHAVPEASVHVSACLPLNHQVPATGFVQLWSNAV